jgi:pimeloyl-ACP methyl ester carboxylesterase
MAESALKDGCLATAAAAFRRASVYYHYAHFMLFDRKELKAELYGKSRAALGKALPIMQYPGKAVFIPGKGKKIPAILREHPKAQGRMVYLFGGADANKEEMVSFADYFLERELTVLAVDNPGQGEALPGLPYSKKNFDETVKIVIAYMKGMGYERLAVGGISFGGYLGPRAAAVAPQAFMAAFGCGGFFDFRDIEKMGPVFYGDFGHVLGVETDEELLAKRNEIDLSDVIANLAAPLMIVHGDNDRIADSRHAKEIVGRSSSIEPRLIVLANANHVCNNYVYKYRPLIADWVAKKLSACRMGVEL